MSEGRSLGTLLVSVEGPGARPATPALDALLLEALQRCRDAWPTITLAPEVFVRYLAQRLSPADPEAGVRELHLTDLYLACACSHTDPEAVRAFEAAFFPDVAGALGRLRATPDQQAEVKQALREQLFVGTADVAPAITTYSGRGPLSGWLRVTAVRAGYRLLARARRDGLGQDELLAAMPTPAEDAEIQYLKVKYRREFREAFERAVRALTPRERTLLRFHHVDGLSLDEIAALYQVHRATIVRWIAGARDTILSRTRAALMAQLHLPRAEYESVMRLIQSQLHVSLSQILPRVDPTGHLPDE
jgi:RNA polymerase sigma-70 factor (ECF subfamily)